MTKIETVIQRQAIIVELERGRRSGDLTRDRARELSELDWDFRQQYGNRCHPLIRYIRDHAGELNQSWNLWFDEIYTSLEHVVVAGAHGGRMNVWELHDTGDLRGPWTALEPFATPINGVFRILRGGNDLANLYFVDETGSIYIGFGAEHRKIGTVRDYHHADETTLTLLFEDQMTEMIGFLHAAEDGTITVLPIDWQDETFAADFLNELDTDRTRAGVARLAEVLREDAEEGGDE